MRRGIAIAAFLVALSAAVPGGRGQAQIPAALPAQALAQMQALAAEKRARTPAQRKIDSQLLFASRMARGQAVAAGLAGLGTDVRTERDGRVVVEVRASVTPALLARLRTLGADVLASHPAYDDVRLLVGFDQLEAIAALPEVRHIAPKAQAITQSRRGELASGGRNSISPSPGAASWRGTASRAERCWPNRCGARWPPERHRIRPDRSRWSAAVAHKATARIWPPRRAANTA